MLQTVQGDGAGSALDGIGGVMMVWEQGFKNLLRGLGGKVGGWYVKIFVLPPTPKIPAHTAHTSLFCPDWHHTLGICFGILQKLPFGGF